MSKSKLNNIILVRVKDLRIHPTAQRALSTAHLKKLRSEFDLDAIGTIHVVEYEINGVTAYWVVDGQHRIAILLAEGFGDWEVEVKVHRTIKDDAGASRKFLELNNRLKVDPFSTFTNLRDAGNPNAVGVTRIANAHGLKISMAGNDGNLMCVSTLTRLFARDNGAALTATIETVLAAWGSIASGLEGKLIEGLGLIYATYNGTVDRPTLVKKLAKYPGGPSALLGDAKGLREYRKISLARCVAEKIVYVYNAGKRENKLNPL